MVLIRLWVHVVHAGEPVIAQCESPQNINVEAVVAAVDVGGGQLPRDLTN